MEVFPPRRNLGSEGWPRQVFVCSQGQLEKVLEVNNDEIAPR